MIIGSLTSNEGIRFALKNLRKGVERAGRDQEEVEVVSWSYMSMLDDEEKAKQNVKRMRARVATAQGRPPNHSTNSRRAHDALSNVRVPRTPR